MNLPAGDDLLPIFSPDGSQIAFEDYSTSADQAKAYVVNTDGTGLHQVNDGDPIALNPVFWSPDGRIVVSYTLGYLTIQLSAADANRGRVCLGGRWGSRGCWSAYRGRR